MDTIRSIVIFGASGMTGQCAVESALDKGYEVTVLARDPSRLSDTTRDRVKVVTGDVLNANDVEQAVQGQDAVVVVLGTRNNLGPTNVMSQGLTNILDAMSTYNVQKIAACMSSFMFWEEEKIPAQFSNIHAEHKKMYALLEACDREWIAVMPPHITAGPGRGEYTVAHNKGPGRTIAKQDLGHFLVHCFDDETNYKQRCGLCDLPQ